jgi:hypothetical protein
LIDQSGTGPLYTGSQVRLAGVNTFTGGVTLNNGNLVLSNPTVTNNSPSGPTTVVLTAQANSSLGTGTFTVNGGTVQFDPAAGSSGRTRRRPTD